MQKIGLIDYYINEWHADNYPTWIRRSALAEGFDVALAWELTGKDGGKALDVWCPEMKVQAASSLEQVVEECDCLIVLSPDNPEHHESLAELPLRSGKPVYIDKTFAHSRAAAERMFALAERHGTPMCSTSALRFSPELREVVAGMNGRKADFAALTGPGTFANYVVHQLEPLVLLMGVGAQRVMRCGGKSAGMLLIDYGCGRRATINQGAGWSFQVSVQYPDAAGTSGAQVALVKDFWEGEGGFVDGLLQFFQSGKMMAQSTETLEIVSIIEAGLAAANQPDEWIAVPGAGR